MFPNYSNKLSENQVNLKVLEAYTRDVGRGVARIDYDAMDNLDASTGDIIEIKEERQWRNVCHYILLMKVAE